MPTPVVVDFRDIELGDLVVISVPPHLHTIEPFGFTVIGPGLFWRRYDGEMVLDAFPPGTTFGFLRGVVPSSFEGSAV
jgi:hypothetical protein